VTPDTKIELLQSALADARVAIVMARDDVAGIVTKIDLIDFLAKAGAHRVSPSTPPEPKGKSVARAPKNEKAKKNGKGSGAKKAKTAAKKPAAKDKRARA
jgi:cystathionine beta-synthase